MRQSGLSLELRGRNDVLLKFADLGPDLQRLLRIIVNLL